MKYYSSLFILLLLLFYTKSIFAISINNKTKIYKNNNIPHNIKLDNIILEQLSNIEKTSFIDIINNENCPSHLKNTISECLTTNINCKSAYFLSKWIQKKIYNKVPLYIIKDLLSQEIHKGLSIWPQDIFIYGYFSKGLSTAKNNIIEFGDFECMHCKKISILIEELFNQYPEDIQIIYKHFPISIHKNSKLLAMIVESAGIQNKFWKLQTLIFKEQNIFDINKLKRLAKILNLNFNNLRKNTMNKIIYCKIINSIKEAKNLMLSGIPSIFFNKKLYSLTHDLYSLSIRLKIENNCFNAP